MIKFLLFLRKIHFVILFLVLEAVAISFFVGGNAYQRARIINASNAVTYVVYERVSGVSRYFGLIGQNEILMSEVASLRQRLSVAEAVAASGEGFETGFGVVDTTGGLRTNVLLGPVTEYQVARVINNSITKRDNYIVVDKGRKNGIEPDMALVSDLGVVGYVVDCSDNYAVALSVLNTSDFKTSGRIKGSDFTGTISWNGLSHRTVELTQVPKYANIKRGDTIVTTDYSNIFPPDLPIGRISDFEMTDGAFYNARVELFADMSTLKYVYLVKLPRHAERDSLESKFIKEE